MIATITPKELHARVSGGNAVDLIDVRTPAEFGEVHVAFARNLPLDRLDPAALVAGRDPAHPLYIICRSGSRGRQACDRLIAAGATNVFNIEGGTHAWDRAGLPVVRGRKAMSLERQVRIAAGSIVLVGAALAWFVDPAWVGLTAFIGAGLVFAGITDTCGMGMIIARMPWNQAPFESAKTDSAPNEAAARSKSCCG
jgi:rhodanese-related sulfurtransferase